MEINPHIWYGLCLSFLILFPGRLMAQEADTLPSLHALRLTDEHERIRVDGRLDEPAWQNAAPATGLQQQEPQEGVPATEKTEVRIAYDEEFLYIGVIAHDREPDKIISRILQRDRVMAADFDNTPVFGGDDAIAILLDPFHDHRNAVVFATNPNGAEFEALITDEGREFNIDWRAVWEVKARRTPQGWTAEFAIPFRTLRYPAHIDESVPWGFNVYRMIRHKNEEVLWSAWSRNNEGFARVSRAGHLYNMTDLPRPGLNLEVKPFTLSGVLQDAEDMPETETDTRFDAGLDMKWEVRPGLLLDVTLNTDFAQVEVDDEQVNLTRFSLFFPEKRDFFLENSGIFEFGSRGLFEPPPFLLFFSRSIGISDDGEVPVLGGARLTGRVGQQTVGLLNVVTNSAFGEPRTNFAVARVKRDVGDSHYIGAIVTDKRSSLSSNSAVGVDGSFWPTRTLNLQGFVARTFTPDENDNNAYRLGVDYQTNHFGVNAQYLMVGADANAEMGFITRSDIRRMGGFARLTARPPILGLRVLNVLWFTEYITRVDGELQDWAVGPALSSTWESGESLVVYYQRGFTRLDESFELADRLDVPVGDYDTWDAGWFASSSANRSVVLNSMGSVQRFYGGRLVSVSANVNLAVGSHLSLAPGYAHNYVSLDSGSFTADIASLRFSYAFSTRLTTNLFVQYNSLDNALSANLRLNFIHRPGSDLFVVFNEQRGTDASTWDFVNRGLVVKLTYLSRI